MNGLAETFAPGTVASVVIAGRTGVDTVNVSDGTVAFGGGNSGASTANLTLHVAAGAAATFSGVQQFAALTLDSGASATLVAGSDSALAVGGLSINGCAAL